MTAYITCIFKDTINTDDIDVGALTIRHPSGRSVTLDVYQTDIDMEGRSYEMKATIDLDALPPCDVMRYDLTEDDLDCDENTATLYVNSDNPVVSIVYGVAGEDRMHKTQRATQE